MSMSPAQDDGEKADPDWAGVIVVLMRELHMSYESICQRTIPQITTLLDRMMPEDADKDGSTAQRLDPDKGKLPTVQDLDYFCSLFSRIG